MGRPRVSPFEKTCIVCGKVFPTPTPDDALRKTCSRVCLGETSRMRRAGKKSPGIGGSPRRSKVEETCVICGNVFPLTISQAAGGRQTCSDECRFIKLSRSKGGLGTGTCEGCGRQYEVSRYHLRRGRRFCNDDCRLEWFATQAPTGEQNPYWRGGGRGYYGPSWREARRNAWQRDNERCTRCGRSSSELGYRPIVHHIIPFKTFGVERHSEANQLDNLACLCRSCHMKVEWDLHRKSHVSDG